MTDHLELATNFDLWRAQYDRLTFQDQKAVYRQIARLYPNQQHANIAEACYFFDTYEPVTVVELGGWDGWLASCVLPEFDQVESWRNFDLADAPQVCADVRYVRTVLDAPLWEHPVVADAFVATHMIEHIRERELALLVASLDVRVCLIESPLSAGEPDWTGYYGTHILEAGWDRVDRLFADAGFRVDYRWDQGRFYLCGS